MSADDKLIYTANQVARFFAIQGPERAAAGVADHLLQFWNPDMRRDFIAAAHARPKDLHPAVAAALPQVEAGSPA